MSNAQDSQAIGAHLVGGLKAPDAEAAMRTTGGILGKHLYALTDGETGLRAQWIQWQIAMLSAVDGIEMGEMRTMPAEVPEYSMFPTLSVDESVTELPAGTLGYARDAKESYVRFGELRDAGAIPAGVKFQVSLPTAYANVALWFAEADQERLFPIYSDALTQELRAIEAAVDADDLMIQFDAAIEIGVLSGGMFADGLLGQRDFILSSLRDSLELPAERVERGVHLCYGDLMHKHFAIPQDLGLCVEVANEAAQRADFIHMPADRETGRESAYFEPLSGLRSDGRLALGVIDYEGDRERTREVVEAARAGADRPFAVATECGMARIDERGGAGPSLEDLLRLHAEFAAPLHD